MQQQLFQATDQRMSCDQALEAARRLVEQNNWAQAEATAAFMGVMSGMGQNTMMWRAMTRLTQQGIEQSLMSSGLSRSRRARRRPTTGLPPSVRHPSARKGPLGGDSPAADKVQAFLARALEATGADAPTTAGALVLRICDVLLSNHSVKAYGRDLSFGPAAALPPGPGSPSTHRCRATR
ncbi:MAG: hypothetical protein JO161_07310 [Planctomycetaceae bacterium]|nr:hypothetical protein [Planctomycetaceae bacterium]